MSPASHDVTRLPHVLWDTRGSLCCIAPPVPAARAEGPALSTTKITPRSPGMAPNHLFGLENRVEQSKLWTHPLLSLNAWRWKADATSLLPRGYPRRPKMGCYLLGLCHHHLCRLLLQQPALPCQREHHTARPRFLGYSTSLNIVSWDTGRNGMWKTLAAQEVMGMGLWLTGSPLNFMPTKRDKSPFETPKRNLSDGEWLAARMKTK